MKKIIIFIGSIILMLGVASVAGCTSKNADIISSSGNASSSDNDSVTGVTYTVTFDSDGGTFVAEICVVGGNKIKEPPAPEKASLEEQYVFEGWYLGDKLWDFGNDIVTENIVLRAKWKLDGKFTIPFVKK